MRFFSLLCVLSIALVLQGFALAAGVPSDDSLTAEFEVADANKDNELSQSEFAKYVLSRFGGAAPASSSSSMTSGFWSAFVNSISMILVTELGDKTFFIAAVMAMKHARAVVYAGAMGALGVMTVLSAGIGFALPQLLPKTYTHYASVVLFAFFGAKLFSEAWALHKAPPGKKNEELEEVEQELGFSAKGDSDGAGNGAGDLESAGSRATEYSDKVSGKEKSSKHQLAVITQAFTLTFLAEWGDRSQIATIALASSQNPVGVTLGGTIGHAFCTGLAVLGGRFLANYISERSVALAGGTLFWIFALHSYYVGP